MRSKAKETCMYNNFLFLLQQYSNCFLLFQEAEKLMKKLNIDTLPVQSGALNVIPREELPDT